MGARPRGSLRCPGIDRIVRFRPFQLRGPIECDVIYRENLIKGSDANGETSRGWHAGSEGVLNPRGFRSASENKTGHDPEETKPIPSFLCIALITASPLAEKNTHDMDNKPALPGQSAVVDLSRYPAAQEFVSRCAEFFDEVQNL